MLIYDNLFNTKPLNNFQERVQHTNTNGTKWKELHINFETRHIPMDPERSIEQKAPQTQSAGLQFDDTCSVSNASTRLGRVTNDYATLPTCLPIPLR